MNNSPEGAQGSANSKTPRTDAAYKAAFSKTSFRVDHFADFTRALECELKNERDGHFLLKNRVLHAANSKEARSACEQMMREEFDRDRGELIATLQRQLAQSEDRVAKLEGALYPLMLMQAENCDGQIGWRSQPEAIAGEVRVKHILLAEAALKDTDLLEKARSEIARKYDHGTSALLSSSKTN